mgnify:CR=1 FL=1
MLLKNTGARASMLVLCAMKTPTSEFSEVRLHAELTTAPFRPPLPHTHPGNEHVIIKHATREEAVPSRSRLGDEVDDAQEEVAEAGEVGGDKEGGGDGASAYEEAADEAGGKPAGGDEGEESARGEDKSETADEKEGP